MSAQNLAPNPSFEVYSTCPDFWNQMDRATGWTRYRGSPDYFNACDSGDFTDVPANAMGQQLASNGQAYAGTLLWCDFPANSREHLGAMLVEPLQIGVPVYVSFKVSPATDGPSQNTYWSANNAGLMFSMNSYLQNGADPLPNHAAVQMINAPMDTAAWYQVSGIYVPDSTYEFIVLGNFFDDATTSTEILNPNGTLNCAYVYYDDICVSYTAEDCNMNTAMPDMFVRNTLQVFPQPFSGQCTVFMEHEHFDAVDLSLWDQLGRIVWRATLAPGQRSIELIGNGLPTGVYTLMAPTSMHNLSPIVLVHVSP